MGLHEIILKLREHREQLERGECPYDLDAILDEFGGWDEIFDAVQEWESALDETDLKEEAKVTKCVRDVLDKWSQIEHKKIGPSSPNPKRFKNRFARNRGGKRKSAGKWYKTAGEAAAAVCAWIGSRKAGSPGSVGVKNNPKQTARKSSVDDPGASLSETKKMPGKPTNKYYGYAAPFVPDLHAHWGESEKRHGPKASEHKGRKKRITGKGVSLRARKALAKRRKGPPPKPGLKHRGFEKEPL